MSGVIRDLVNAVPVPAFVPAMGEVANGYLSVYGIEILLLFLTVAVILPLVRQELLARDDVAEPAA